MPRTGSRVIFVVLALLVSGTGGGRAPKSFQLPVPLNPQETNHWCWAASAQMVKNWVRPDLNVQQCDEASKADGNTNCCDTPEALECDTPRWPNFRTSDFKSEDTWGTGSPPPTPAVPPAVAPLDWKTIKDEIYKAQRPFVFAWKERGGSGHMVVITGYDRHNGVRSVWVNDPLPLNEGATYYKTYDWYAGESADAKGWHWRDIYGIEYIGTGD